MAARDMANGVGHRDHGEPEGERDAEHPKPSCGKAAPNTALPQPANTNQNSPIASAASRFAMSLPWNV
jgi:hypothetical protein